jgi:hypothetical protein
MILLSGPETEAAWLRVRVSDPPPDAASLVNAGAEHDRDSAVDLALRVTGGDPYPVESYLEWARQRVLSHTGRPESDIREGTDTREANSLRDGSARYWRLVGRLADAVQAAGTLSWRRARTVLGRRTARACDPSPDRGALGAQRGLAPFALQISDYRSPPVTAVMTRGGACWPYRRPDDRSPCRSLPSSLG